MNNELDGFKCVFMYVSVCADIYFISFVHLSNSHQLTVRNDGDQKGSSCQL